MRSNERLKNRFLVSRPYQLRFVARILLVVIVATCLSAGGAYIFTKGEMESGFFSGHRKLVNLHEALPKVLAVSSLVTFVAMAFLGSYITLRETHRVVGPVNRMENKFREMTEGNFSYMESFRKDDVLKGLDDSINLHLNNLGDFFITFERAMGEINMRLAALEKDKGSTEENLERIRKLLAEIDHYADAFRSN
jgi:hypothetical protein